MNPLEESPWNGKFRRYDGHPSAVQTVTAALCLLCLLCFPAVTTRADVLGHWEKGTISTEDLAGVAYGNDTFVAVGHNALYTAGSNGWPWKQSANFSEDITWSGVAFGQGVFVAVGTINTPGYVPDVIATSLDGVKWTATLSDSDGPWHKVAFVNNQFVAYDGITDFDAYGSQIAGYVTSADGYSWSEAYFGLNYLQVFALSVENGLYVASTGSDIWASPGLGTFGYVAVHSNVERPRTSDYEPPYGGQVAGFSGAINGLASGNGTSVAVGASGIIGYSLNQTNWYSANSGTGNTLEAVTCADGFFVAVGADGTILSSPNGQIWSARNPGTAPLFQGVVFGNNHFVAVGVNGTVAISSDETPASITGDPHSQTVIRGGSVTFTATAADATSYKWQKNSGVVADNSRISGATTGTLTINDVVTSDAGTYSLLVKNSFGQATSSGAVLTVEVLSAPLTVQTNGPGKISPAYNGKLLEIGNTYSMTATPDPGCKFVGWSGGSSATSPTVKFVMASNLEFTATFVETARPTCSITRPTVNQKFTTGTITVTGKASDKVGVTQVLWQLNNGGWQPAVATDNWTSWSIANLPLAAGQNTLQAYAQNAAGLDSPTATVHFTYVPSVPK